MQSPGTMGSFPGSQIPPPVVVDASVWVSFFLIGDSTHAASYKWINDQTAAGGMLIAPSILLIEVAAALSRNVGLPVGAQPALNAALISKLPQSRIVPMDAILISEATDVAATFGLRGADSIYVAVARQLGIPLLTWDKEQLTRTARIIVAFHP